MIDVKKVDEVMYRDRYIKHCYTDYEFVWECIRNKKDALEEAIVVKRDKFDENDTFTHLAIVEAMLMDYENIDMDVYNKLVSLIYSNQDLARIVLNGAANGGYSFLLFTLFNHDLVLTEEMKAFAVNEAMNKIGTSRWYKRREEYSAELVRQGVTDDKTVQMEIDGCVVPMGAKTGCEYLYSMMAGLSEELAHGTGEFDIRYQILRNPNWTREEKEKLVYEFYVKDDVYDEYLELWEWGIINDDVNCRDGVPVLDKSELSYYTYDELLAFFGNEKDAKYLYDEIEFCKMMHQIRPQEWERDFPLKK